MTAACPAQGQVQDPMPAIIRHLHSACDCPLQAEIGTVHCEQGVCFSVPIATDLGAS